MEWLFLYWLFKEDDCSCEDKRRHEPPTPMTDYQLEYFHMRNQERVGVANKRALFILKLFTFNSIILCWIWFILH